MTDIELHQLATEYAEQNPPVDIKDEVLKGNLIGLNAEIFEKFLIWLTKTHCIVSRELILSQHAWYMQRMKEVSSARQTNRAKAIALEAAFGKSIFENNKTIDNEDNKDV